VLSSVSVNTTAVDAPTSATRPRIPAVLTVLACWLVIVFDGYDLIVFGAVKPVLMQEGWGLTQATAGTLGSVAFIGMMIGALIAGRLSDTLGRVRTIVACTLLFTLATVACGLVDSVFAFGLLRLVAGLGLGGVMPATNALATTLVPARLRGVMTTIMMSGVPVGGSAASLIGLSVIPAAGWRPMFFLPLLVMLVALPLLLWGVSALGRAGHDVSTTGAPARVQAQRVAAGTSAELAAAGSDAGSGYGALFRSGFARTTIVFSLAFLCCLFVWFGLGTELPNLMTQAGYGLGSALTFSLALNLGAVGGSVLTAWASVRFGTVPTAAVAAAVCVLGLLLMLTHPSTGMIYVCMVAAGIGTHGTQCLVMGAVAQAYPDHLRGTALGVVMGFGRLGAILAPQLTGLLLAARAGVPSVFLAYACGGLGVTILLATSIRRSRRAAHATVLD
jgi:AAHS family benzoate transporter-like MFS transporter